MSSTVGNYTGFLSGQTAAKKEITQPVTPVVSNNNSMPVFLHGDTLITMGDGTKKKLRLCQVGEEIKTIAPWSAWIGKLSNADGTWNAQGYRSFYMPNSFSENTSRFRPWAYNTADLPYINNAQGLSSPDGVLIRPIPANTMMTAGKAAIHTLSNFGAAPKPTFATSPDYYSAFYDFSAVTSSVAGTNAMSVFDSVNPQVAAPSNMRVGFILTPYIPTLIGIRYFKTRYEYPTWGDIRGTNIVLGSYTFMYVDYGSSFGIAGGPWTDYLLTPLNNSPPVENSWWLSLTHKKLLTGMGPPATGDYYGITIRAIAGQNSSPCFFANDALVA